MSWQTEMVAMVRQLTNDVTVPYLNSDARLAQLIAMSAQLVQNEITFDTTYTVDVANSTISPDPTTPVRDNKFINFVVLRAACIVDQGAYRTKAMMEGVKAVAGPATLAVSGGASAFKTILTMGACKAYDELKFNGTQADFIRAVLSPFNSDDFDPTESLANQTDGNWFDDPRRSNR